MYVCMYVSKVPHMQGVCWSGIIKSAITLTRSPQD